MTFVEQLNQVEENALAKIKELVSNLPNKTFIFKNEDFSVITSSDSFIYALDVHRIAIIDNMLYLLSASVEEKTKMPLNPKGEEFDDFLDKLELDEYWCEDSELILDNFFLCDLADNLVQAIENKTDD